MMKPKSLVSLTLSSMMLWGLTASLTAVAHSQNSPTNSPSIAHSSLDMEPDMEHSMPADHSAPDMDHGSMNLGPKDEFLDLRFIDAMILHHQGAVRMAEEALQKSDRLSVRQMARQMIRDQGRELRRMQNWRQSWYPDAATQPVTYAADKQQTIPMSDSVQDVMMMNVEMGSADDDFDLRFINAMIPHHEGAVAMAGEALQKSDRPEIRRLSRSILGAQQQEIVQMRTWRNRWYR